jgi:hypothetical protein
MEGGRRLIQPATNATSRVLAASLIGTAIEFYDFTSMPPRRASGGGAALLAVENAPAGWAGRFGMVPQLGALLGFLVANGLFLLIGLLLSPDQFPTTFP